MEYQIEELLPITARLIEKYTSKESTSVPYETANMIMEAVIYCIEENRTARQSGVVMPEKMPDAKTMYETGYELVIQNVHLAREIFEQVTVSFEDYGCENYRNTVVNGMPEFFLRYDPKFKPQDHLLTLDYPLLGGNPKRCGIDMILDYLQGIQTEQTFLNCFPHRAVMAVLAETNAEYRELYLDNICEAVLFRALCCMVAGSSLKDLQLSAEDLEEIRFYFKDQDRDQTERKVRQLLMVMMQKMECDTEYFIKVVKDFAFRIRFC